MIYGKLAIPRCDKCNHIWHARYRKAKPVRFFCPRCGRKHPRWTADMIERNRILAESLLAKMHPLNVA